MAAEIVEQLFALDEESDDPIVIHLNTAGGALLQALAIYDTMRAISSPVVVVAMGQCASAGLLLLTGGDARFAYPHTCFFYHEPVGMIVTDSVLAAKEHNENYVWSTNIYNKLVRQVANIPDNIWRERFENRTAGFFYVEEAKEWGFIHDTISMNGEKIEVEKWLEEVEEQGSKEATSKGQ